MENEMNIETAPSIKIPSSPIKCRAPRDGESECMICRKPIKLDGHSLFLWVHLGGSHAVTQAEGARLNAEGHSGGDLGDQPIGKDCLRRHPELKAYLVPEGK